MQHIHQESSTAAQGEPPVTEAHSTAVVQQTADSKTCSRCGGMYPLSHYLKRTGRKSGRSSRRGTCRDCRKQLKAAAQDGLMVESGSVKQEQKLPLPAPHHPAPEMTLTNTVHSPQHAQENHVTIPAVSIVTARPVRSLPSIEHKDIRGHGLDLAVLRPTRRGIVHMRGRTDKGRRWHQETDLETAATLVREYAAVVVNRHTIRRLYSNRSFRKYILERDQYTCYFCGGSGDTIDHLLPRARGGHTTPLNCVCACNLCNQTKADHDLHHFIQPVDSPDGVHEGSSS
ncbi:HNH endonuclease [Paenibacillus sp. WLX2291]|uniref:HNH endonuclease n=1 Tax=Paenibacillus sp. WLX2291 TaxID=3296934 RepID=UPI003983EB6C